MVEVSRAEFEDLVADALDSIPEQLAAEMENVAVMVADWPTPEQLAEVAPDREGARVTLFGLYEGIPATARGPMSYSGVAPDRITIFEGPLSRACRDRDELAAQVRVTVLHEIGHAFGMTDARLHELGWA